MLLSLGPPAHRQLLHMWPSDHPHDLCEQESFKNVSFPVKNTPQSTNVYAITSPTDVSSVAALGRRCDVWKQRFQWRNCVVGSIVRVEEYRHGTCFVNSTARGWLESSAADQDSC